VRWRTGVIRTCESAKDAQRDGAAVEAHAAAMRARRVLNGSRHNIDKTNEWIVQILDEVSGRTKRRCYSFLSVIRHACLYGAPDAALG
jgi:hypothetical protein